MTIDHTRPTGVYRVSTVRDSQYMGPDILVNANSDSQARRAAESLGYEVNKYFPPERTK